MADQVTNDIIPQQAETAVVSSVPASATAPQISPTPLPRKPKQDRPPEDDPGIWRLSRRNVLTLAGWLGFFGFIITSTVGALRFMFPRVLFEPPAKFKAGFPQDFTIGEVSEKYKDEKRVWIVRERDGFYALIAICTHLGCTPRWLPSDNKFKCPCHGSGFYRTGVNFEGPAPRPLERAYIGLADDGQIEVDRNIKFIFEKGEWGKPGSFLNYTG
jgi:cytochrome b6-f complex iron-sulfur subunit